MGNTNATVDSFACTGCGADLEYKPGTSHLACQFCGAENEIPVIDAEIKELDFYAYLDQSSSSEEQLTESFVKCNGCGVSTTLEPNVTSSNCPYCDTPLVLDSAHDENVIKPRSLLPFKLSKDDAKESFKQWVKKLWFAPNRLKKATHTFDHFKGVYVPYWTYDTNTSSNYIGQRGEDYYVTERYTETVDGKRVSKTRQVKKIRWYTVHGRVDRNFDDILVVASNSLPRKYMDKLEPWDLGNLKPFDTSYLSGFITEKYQVELKEGFDIAKDQAEKDIRKAVKRDIGGDHQRISQLSTQWNDISFKHLLLPVFVSAYKFKDKLYQFVINARTGEVQGERPLSWAKIMAVAIPVAAAIGYGVYYYYMNQ